MKLHNPFWLDTTELAKTQDAVIRGEEPASSLLPFEPLCKIQEELNGVTNLGIRQDWLLGRKERANRDFGVLYRYGYWPEGPDYLQYVCTAWEKDERTFNASEYPKLIAPDGTIPVPESSARTFSIPPDLPDYHCDPTYLVKRWKDEHGVYGYILICIDTILRHTRNLHTHPTPGHAVLWINGQWVLPPHRYTGFNYDDVFHEIDRLNLPKGAFKPLEWRLNPPQVWVGVKPGWVEIRYEGFFAPKRVIEFGSDYVRVRDSWLLRKNRIQEWKIERN